MTSFVYDIGEKERAGSRFIAHVRSEVQDAFLEEKKLRKITQQQLATKLGVNRSVVNRQLMGLDKMTLRSVAELLWAMGWDPEFKATKEPHDPFVNNKDSARVEVKFDEKISKLPSTETGSANAEFKLELVPA